MLIQAYVLINKKIYLCALHVKYVTKNEHANNCVILTFSARIKTVWLARLTRFNIESDGNQIYVWADYTVLLSVWIFLWTQRKIVQITQRQYFKIDTRVCWKFNKNSHTDEF